MCIRTKDGVYEVEWNSCVEMWCDVKTHRGFILDSMISKVDYKLSENLEELCDEFVYVVNDTIHKLILGEHSLKEAIEETKKYSKRTIYGAIWTDKGLIYVAKINDEGDWKLV